MAALYDPFILIVSEEDGVISLVLSEMVGLVLTRRGTLQIAQMPTSIALSTLNGRLCGLFASADKLSILNFSEKMGVADLDQLMNDEENCKTYLDEEVLMKAVTYHMDGSHQCKFL